MQRTFEPVFGGVAPSAIDAFERKSGWKLPDDYRQFLLKHNGGRPVPKGACLVKAVTEYVLVDMLFGLNQRPGLDIQEWLNQFREELPPNCFIIGGVGGLLFVLCLRGVNEGVLCWDRMGELRKLRDSESGSLYPIAATFTEFISSLEPVE
jgi:hypothetical protein